MTELTLLADPRSGGEASEVTGAGEVPSHPGVRKTGRGDTLTSLTHPASLAHISLSTAAASCRGNQGGLLALSWSGNTVVSCNISHIADIFFVQVKSLILFFQF